jgi:hypothetical protein
MNQNNITNLCNGAVIEQVEYELQKVLSNIADPNTEPQKKRKITLTLVVRGDNERELADVEFETKSVLAPARKISTRIAFEKHGNEIVTQELQKGSMAGQTIIDAATGEILESKVTTKKIVSIK